MSGDLAFAAAAGTLAAVNPCGFAMLPGYLVLFAASGAGTEAGPPPPVVALRRALVSSAVVTAGFVAVFGAFGLLLTPVADTIARWAPALTVAVGVVLAGVGVLMLAGRKVSVRVPGLRVAGLAGEGPVRVRTMFVYGISYAVTSLGCAIGPFLAVVATTLRSGDVGTGLASYAAYALGMGSVVALLAVTTALAQRSKARPFRHLARYTAPAGGVLLLAVGAYVAWYGAYEIRVRAGGSPADPLIERGGSLQAALARRVDALGPTGVALVLAALALGVLVAGARGRQRARG